MKTYVDAERLKIALASIAYEDEAWLMDTLARKREDQLKRIEGLPQGDILTRAYALLVKRLSKAVVHPSKHNEAPVAAQSLSVMAAEATVLWSPHFSALQQVFLSALKDEYILATDAPEATIGSHITNRLLRANVESVYSIEDDASKFDKSQALRALIITCMILAFLNFPQWSIGS